MSALIRLRLIALAALCSLTLNCAEPTKNSETARPSNNAHASAASTPSPLPSPAPAEAKSSTRAAGESLQSFGARVIPQGTRLEHPVIEVDFGSAGKSLIVLFNQEKYRPFTGWVFLPQGDGYRKLVLPETQFPISTQVKAVFSANADRDPEPELLILCEHISGIGRAPSNITPFCNTYVYDLAGESINHLEDVETALEPAGEKCTAAHIRRQLKHLGY